MSVVTQSSVDHKYMGVATSGRQFFMQTGQVLGTAILGVILATSYTSAFSHGIPPEAAAEIRPETLERFDDPTLPLDDRQFPAIRDEILALPGGEAVLAGTLTAQRDAMASAIVNVFRVSLGATIVILLLAITIPAIPLRRGFRSEPPVAASDAKPAAPPAGTEPAVEGGQPTA
jgi:hypothetical protein